MKGATGGKPPKPPKPPKAAGDGPPPRPPGSPVEDAEKAFFEAFMNAADEEGLTFRLLRKMIRERFPIDELKAQLAEAHAELRAAIAANAPARQIALLKEKVAELHGRHTLAHRLRQLSSADEAALRWLNICVVPKVRVEVGKLLTVDGNPIGSTSEPLEDAIVFERIGSRPPQLLIAELQKKRSALIDLGRTLPEILATDPTVLVELREAYSEAAMEWAEFVLGDRHLLPGIELDDDGSYQIHLAGDMLTWIAAACVARWMLERRNAQERASLMAQRVGYVLRGLLVPFDECGNNNALRAMWDLGGDVGLERSRAWLRQVLPRKLWPKHPFGQSSAFNPKEWWDRAESILYGDKPGDDG